MKRVAGALRRARKTTFSALGRAVWDETSSALTKALSCSSFSALGRAVWDETCSTPVSLKSIETFSALGRAVWDETVDDCCVSILSPSLSVLSVEPYGMKPGGVDVIAALKTGFQCSRSSRMG